jgi:uncharacterized protein (TIGR03437 family)
MIREAQVFSILLAFVYTSAARGQAPAVTLKIELQNLVEYREDILDPSQWGINPNITPISATTPVKCLGQRAVSLGDIVAVNGRPAKGTYVSRAVILCTNATPNPTQPIADTQRSAIAQHAYEILQSDGTPVGTITASGLNGGSPSPPGPPAGDANMAIVGGTGAFLGTRGQTASGVMQGLGGTQIPGRLASIMEDPANRRQNGGGHVVYTLYVIPLSWPTIMTTADGPAVTHSNDSSLVSASKPAAAGEMLTLVATGLGPTRPGMLPGQPFPSSPAAVVNSPMDVTVNGKSAEVLEAIGLAGTTDSYQVTFRLPSGTASGTASIQITAAWIPGALVSIAVQ